MVPLHGIRLQTFNMAVTLFHYVLIGPSETLATALPMTAQGPRQYKDTPLPLRGGLLLIRPLSSCSPNNLPILDAQIPEALKHASPLIAVYY